MFSGYLQYVSSEILFIRKRRKTLNLGSLGYGPLPGGPQHNPVLGWEVSCVGGWSGAGEGGCLFLRRESTEEAASLGSERQGPRGAGSWGLGVSLALDQDSETAVCRGHRIRTMPRSREALPGGLGGQFSAPGRLSLVGGGGRGWAGECRCSWWGGWECLARVDRLQLRCLQSLSMFGKKRSQGLSGLCGERRGGGTTRPPFVLVELSRASFEYSRTAHRGQ